MTTTAPQRRTTLLDRILDRSGDRPLAGVATGSGRAVEVATLFIVAGALIGSVIAGSLMRQPWYDELYTFYVTRPSLGLWEALRHHWLTDNHPPLFYALARATAWLGDSVEARRFVNLPLLIAAIFAAVWAMRRRGDRRAMAAAFAIFLIAQIMMLAGAAELRSYFLSMGSCALMVLAVTLVWTDEEEPDRRARVLLFGTVLVAFNTHIVTSLIAASVLLPFVAVALMRRDWGRLRAVAVPAILAGVLFTATVAVQASLWVANTTIFWIPAGFGAARWTIEMTAIRAAVANPVLLIGAAAGMVLLAARALRERSIPRDLEAAVLLGVGCVIAVALIVAIHLERPIVVEKYLVGLLAALGMIIAIGFAGLLAACRRTLSDGLLALAAAVSLVVLSANLDEVRSAPGWDGTARLIGQQVAACPDAAVHTDAYWNRDLNAMSPPDNAAVVRFGYRFMAQRYGFAVEPVRSLRVSATCPTLFWAEHATRLHPDDAEILARIRSRGYAVSRIAVTHVGDGWVARSDP